MEATLGQIPEGERGSHLMNVQIQVEAQYAMLEANTDQSFLEKDVVFIAPPEGDEALMSEYKNLLEVLDIELEEDEEAEEIEEEQEVEEESEKPVEEEK